MMCWAGTSFRENEELWAGNEEGDFKQGTFHAGTVMAFDLFKHV